MKFFQTALEIRNKLGALHFKRFAIFECSFFAIYVHRIYKEDKDPYCHNHPWNYFSILLDGAYTEKYMVRHTDIFLEDYYEENYRTKGFCSVSYGTRDGYHKIYTIDGGPVTTLFLTFGKKRPWGYLITDNEVNIHMDSEDYRRKKNESK